MLNDEPAKAAWEIWNHEFQNMDPEIRGHEVGYQYHFTKGYEAGLAARCADAAAQALEDAADEWPTMTRDMVSRGHVRDWLRERAKAYRQEGRADG